MREIIFRGKNIETGEWVYGNLIQGEVGGKTFYQIEHSVLEDFRLYEVKAETVGQFTGLTDKNGVKIFEGDIVRYVGSRAKHVVTFDDHSFVLCKGRRVDVYNWSGELVEVITNIHEK